MGGSRTADLTQRLKVGDQGASFAAAAIEHSQSLAQKFSSTDNTARGCSDTGFAAPAILRIMDSMERLAGQLSTEVKDCQDLAAAQVVNVFSKEVDGLSRNLQDARCGNM